jgi:hypothetical protein
MYSHHHGILSVVSCTLLEKEESHCGTIVATKNYLHFYSDKVKNRRKAVRRFHRHPLAHTNIPYLQHEFMWQEIEDISYKQSESTMQLKKVGKVRDLKNTISRKFTRYKSYNSSAFLDF